MPRGNQIKLHGNSNLCTMAELFESKHKCCSFYGICYRQCNGISEYVELKKRLHILLN